MIKELTENLISIIIALALILLTVTYYSNTLAHLVTSAFDRLPH